MSGQSVGNVSTSAADLAGTRAVSSSTDAFNASVAEQPTPTPAETPAAATTPPAAAPASKTPAQPSVAVSQETTAGSGPFVSGQGQLSNVTVSGIQVGQTSAGPVMVSVSNTIEDNQFTRQTPRGPLVGESTRESTSLSATVPLANWGNGPDKGSLTSATDIRFQETDNTPGADSEAVRVRTALTVRQNVGSDVQLSLTARAGVSSTDNAITPDTTMQTGEIEGGLRANLTPTTAFVATGNVRREDVSGALQNSDATVFTATGRLDQKVGSDTTLYLGGRHVDTNPDVGQGTQTSTVFLGVQQKIGENSALSVEGYTQLGNPASSSTSFTNLGDPATNGTGARIMFRAKL